MKHKCCQNKTQLTPNPFHCQIFLDQLPFYRYLSLTKQLFFLGFYLEIALANLSEGAETLRLNSEIWLAPVKLSLLIFFFLPMLKISMSFSQTDIECSRKFDDTYSDIKTSSRSSLAVALFSWSGSKHLLIKIFAVSDISGGISG